MTNGMLPTEFPVKNGLDIGNINNDQKPYALPIHRLLDESNMQLASQSIIMLNQ